MTLLTDNAQRWIQQQDIDDEADYDDIVDLLKGKYKLTQAQLFHLRSELANVIQKSAVTAALGRLGQHGPLLHTALFGRKAELPIDILFGSPLENSSPVAGSKYVEDLSERLELVHKYAREKL